MPVAGRSRRMSASPRGGAHPASGPALARSFRGLAVFDNPVAVLFGQHVSDTIDTPVLRWSVRQRLLADARRLGLPRFEANLIIAVVQRRCSSTAHREPRRSVLVRMAPWAVFLAVQGLIALAGWRIICP